MRTILIGGLLFVAGVLVAFGYMTYQQQSVGQPTAPVTHASSTASSSAGHMGVVSPLVAKDVPATIATSSSAPTTPIQPLDLTKIPLGDGKVSTGPRVGYVYSCTQQFRGGGADHAGAWIQGGTWNLNNKISVAGKVNWPNALFSDVVSGISRLITGNGLPVGSHTGTFPIAQTDPAYQYDRNPNSIEAQQVDYTLPASPSFALGASCVPMGPIGVALNGVAIFNALDDGGRDAVAHEVQDSCDGHPQSGGEYHYHGPSPCMPNVDKQNTVVGYALDGFPITSLYNSDGLLYTNTDLDACHGTTGAYTDENGKQQNGYHYVLTWEYPYTVGCFHGTPVVAKHDAQTQTEGTVPPNQQNAQTSGQSGGGGTPPTAAVTACAGSTSNASCSFTTQNGTVSGNCRTTPDGSFACVPQ